MDHTIATHRVKPSSSTPLPSKTHKLSCIEQLTFPFYIPLIFFYQNCDFEQPEISRRLKQSLSETLTLFYPFAGTIIDNSFVDCDDSGAELVEARIHARLSQFTRNPNPEEELKQFLPIANHNLLLLVKVSYFDCGGFAVGICLSHKIADASSLIIFMNAWAAACRGEASRITPPSFDLALHFPPTDINTGDYDFSRGTKYLDERVVTKRLVFEREKLEKLKKLESSSKVKDLTTVEALSAFIWKASIEACKAAKSTGPRVFATTQAVNLRRRTVPPIPDQAIGSCVAIVPAVVSCEEDERERESGVHVSKLRAAMRGVDEDYINHKMKDGEKLSRTLGGVRELYEAMTCTISSWWRFPMYEVDFGWGKPVWVCTCNFPYRDRVILMSNPSGDGIEAWINVSHDNLLFLHLLEASSNDILLP